MTLKHLPTTRKERAAAKKVIVSVGEIFRVPLSESFVGYGQVLAETMEGTLIFVCLFDTSSSTGEDPPSARSFRPRSRSSRKRSRCSFNSRSGS